MDTVEDANLIAHICKIISKKCIQNDSYEKVKESIEYAFNECPKKCIGGHYFKCEEIKRHVEQKVCSNQPVDNNVTEENSLRKVVFFHSLRCKYLTNCKIPKCASINVNLKKHLIPNLKTESIFHLDQKLCVMFSIKEVKSIIATAKSMALLSTIGESTNIVIPLLVLETTNYPKICYQIMILAEMDLKFVVNNGPITENLIAYLIKGVLNGIWYLHRRGYVHCDLKLENIVVKDYHAYVCDIDFVKEEAAKCDVTTTYYSAPEVYDGIANKPLDIHCIGLVLARLANVDISMNIDHNDLLLVKKIKIVQRNKRVFDDIKMTHPKFLQVFYCCTKEVPSQRSTVDELINNHLFQVNVETVSNEINYILSKKSSQSINFGIQDDLANNIVQLHLNQILDNLPKNFN
ncbi:5'-AMP-activated serine/threonine-protein kinase catalytic subunit alpha isoform X3 [Hydra vulgaris]|uniref:5'-AMP-activated serine/threonine-protein kinase catalytic subunit alpha isoform X3 n=1 Tax=Hydra vulgaris TaxID=6087 RepID=A0ABM4D9Y5_HYDVU